MCKLENVTGKSFKSNLIARDEVCACGLAIRKIRTQCSMNLKIINTQKGKAITQVKFATPTRNNSLTEETEPPSSLSNEKSDKKDTSTIFFANHHSN